MYENELQHCAHIATRDGLYEVVEILIEYGFDSSMNKDFVIRAFRQGHADICDLLVSNGFPFIFQHCVTACIYHSGEKTKETVNDMVNFIYQYYIDQDPIDTELLKWIRKNKKNLDRNNDSLDKYGMSGEEFLTIVFTEALIFSVFQKAMNAVKAIIATELNFYSTIEHLVDHNKVDDENICSYLKSVIKNNK